MWISVVVVHAANYDAVWLVTTFEMVKLEGCNVSTGNIAVAIPFILNRDNSCTVITLRIKLISREKIAHLELVLEIKGS